MVICLERGPLSSLSATNTTSSSCLPKKSTTPAWYLQPSTNPKRLWKTVNKLLHRKSSSPLPITSPGTSLADSFTSFITGKISKLRLFLLPATLLHHLHTHPLLLPLPLISQTSVLLQNPKSTRSCPTVHSKLDYCNSLYHNLPKSQITRLQQIQNSPARAVVKAHKSSHTTPILQSLHWLKITERIEYKLLSLTYKVLTLAALALHLWSHSLAHPHHLLYE